MNPEILAMVQLSLDMFVTLAVELTLLFLGISYAVGVLQAFITPEKVQSILSSKNGRGYVVAAFLGAITPFCSCSTIPFLKGLLRARAGFGPMIVFLFASPLLNPIVIGLFIVTFGLDIAMLYFGVAMTVSVMAGVTLEKFGFERFIKPEAYGQNVNLMVDPESSCCEPKGNDIACVSENTACSDKKVDEKTASCCVENVATVKSIEVLPELSNRWWKIWLDVWADFKQVFPYFFISIAIGAVIYGFVPTQFIVDYLGDNQWYAIPLAAVIGIPLYIRATAMIPLCAALVQKGMALGSIMALIIGSAGASLTEVILLKSIFKTQMIVAFLAVVLGMAVTAGYLYRFLF